MRRASDREVATEERIRSEYGGKKLQKNLADGVKDRRGKVAKLNTQRGRCSRGKRGRSSDVWSEINK